MLMVQYKYREQVITPHKNAPPCPSNSNSYQFDSDMKLGQNSYKICGDDDDAGGVRPPRSFEHFSATRLLFLR